MTELLIILVLLLLNGFFAMSEIAILSVRKSRLEDLAQPKDRDEEPNAGAAVALKLSQHPENFLSTVQVGITLVGVIASAFAGENLKGHVKSWILANVPSLKETADQWAFFIVVTFITLLSVVVGELVPKALALRNPVGIACATAKFMNFLSRAAFPLVWLLGKITRLVLLPFGKPQEDSFHRQDLDVVVREGVVRESIKEEEAYIVSEAMKFSTVRAEEVMIAKPMLAFIHVNDDHKTIAAKIKKSQNKVFPVYRDNRDDVIGIVSIDALYTWLAEKPAEPINWPEVMHEVEPIPENQTLHTLYKQLQKTKSRGGVVVDEFGTVRGIITLNELMEEVFGDPPAQSTPGPTDAVSDRNDGRGVRVLKRDGDHFIELMIDGVAEIDHVVENYFPTFSQEVEKYNQPFQTIAGFVMHALNKLPEEGLVFHSGEFEFEVVDMDTLRLDKVKVRRMTPEEVAQLEEADE
jgi:putative hemolysin